MGDYPLQTKTTRRIDLMPDSKEARQTALVELLTESPYYSQQEICDAMKAAGFSAAQPSISRDLQELGIIKFSGRYLPPSALKEKLPEGLTDAIIPAGPHMIVVRTKLGAAQRVAAEIDAVSIEGLIGTVAGDDTIFLAFDDPSQQAPALDFLTQKLL